MENEVVAKRTIGERLFALAQDFGKLLKTKKFWWELFIMTAGMFVASIAVYFFLIPSKLIVGSITGLSLVIGKLFPILSVGNIIFCDQRHTLGAFLPTHCMSLEQRRSIQPSFWAPS